MPNRLRFPMWIFSRYFVYCSLYTATSPKIRGFQMKAFRSGWIGYLYSPESFDFFKYNHRKIIRQIKRFTQKKWDLLVEFPILILRIPFNRRVQTVRQCLIKSEYLSRVSARCTMSLDFARNSVDGHKQVPHLRTSPRNIATMSLTLVLFSCLLLRK